MAITVNYWDSNDTKQTTTGTTTASVELSVSNDADDNAFVDLYVDYTAGDEDYFEIRVAYKGRHGTDYFYGSYWSSYYVRKQPLKLDTSDKYYIPIPISNIHKDIKLEFEISGGTTPGTVTVDIERVI